MLPTDCFSRDWISVDRSVKRSYFPFLVITRFCDERLEIESFLFIMTLSVGYQITKLATTGAVVEGVDLATCNEEVGTGPQVGRQTVGKRVEKKLD